MSPLRVCAAGIAMLPGECRRVIRLAKTLYHELHDECMCVNRVKMKGGVCKK